MSTFYEYSISDASGIGANTWHRTGFLVGQWSEDDVKHEILYGIERWAVGTRFESYLKLRPCTEQQCANESGESDAK